MKVKYSAKAQTVIGQLKDFDKEDFESWFRKESLTAGSKAVWAYMLSKTSNPVDDGAR